ncbi:MAG: DegV family protein [Oscillospiraceae bacterium]|nr:DegV family protein [Oscillospiraceae bacterium]
MVRIITDSAADFEPAELERLNIVCIPLTVQIGEEAYQENINLSKEKFYTLLEQTKEFPKTSQAPIQTVLDIYEDAKKAGDDAVHITISSAISGTYQTALAIRDMAEYDRCHVVDSLNATGGQRMLVEYAVKLRDEGKSAAEIAYAVEAMRGRIILFACMDTLEYLYLGGRISRTVYTLGSMAQIKPIIRVAEDGSIEVPAKAMGMRKGLDILCKKIAANPPSPDFPIYAMYTGNREGGVKMAERIRAMGYDVPDERIINVGAAIGSHVGPNALGFVYIKE